MAGVVGDFDKSISDPEISVSNCLKQRSKDVKVHGFAMAAYPQPIHLKSPRATTTPPPEPKYCWKTLRIKDLASNS